jgi:hypothetical protein
VARPEVVEEGGAHEARPEVSRVVAFPNRIDAAEAAKRKQVGGGGKLATPPTSSPIQGVGSLLEFSGESVDEQSPVDLDEIFLRAIDIRL